MRSHSNPNTVGIEIWVFTGAARPSTEGGPLFGQKHRRCDHRQTSSCTLVELQVLIKRLMGIYTARQCGPLSPEISGDPRAAPRQPNPPGTRGPNKGAKKEVHEPVLQKRRLRSLIFCLLGSPNKPPRRAPGDLKKKKGDSRKLQEPSQ